MKIFVIIVKTTTQPVVNIDGTTSSFNSKKEAEQQIKDHPKWNEETHSVVMLRLKLKV